MAYILDIAVILIFALAIFIGYKRGFMKTILRLVGVVLALVIASSVSKPAAGWIYDQFLASSIQEQIVAHVPSTDTATLESGLQAAMGSDALFRDQRFAEFQRRIGGRNCAFA